MNTCKLSGSLSNNLVAAIVFCLVERLVGAPQQGVGALAINFQCGNTHGSRDSRRRARSRDPERNARHSVTQPLGHLGGDLRSGIRHHHHKLFTTVAAGKISATHGTADALGKFAQHIITAFVTVGIVDRLEVVDIGDQHRQRSSATVGTIHQRRQMGVEVAAVVEPGQSVGDGKLDRLR